MGMDKRTWIAIALMVLIYLTFLAPKPQEPSEQPDTPAQQEVAQEQDLPEPRAEPETQKIKPNRQQLIEKRIELSNEVFEIEIDGLGRVLHAQLKDYFEEPEGKEPVAFEFPGYLNEDKTYVDGSPVVWRLVEQSSNMVRWVSKLRGVELTKTLSLEPNAYHLDYRLGLMNRSRSTQEVQVLKSLRMEQDPEESGGFFSRMFRPQGHFQQIVWFQDGDLESELLTEVPEESSNEPMLREGALEWTGFGTKYFFFGMHPDTVGIQSLHARRLASTRVVEEEVKLRPRQLEPGGNSEIQYQYYVGPKKMEDLRATGETFTRVIDYGNWIGPISRLLLGVLEFFHKIIPNYGIAIILLTILVKLLLFPLAYKAAVSMRKLQVVGPKMKELREKYKSDPQRLNSEVMALYKREKVNPVGGCLPMLLQMPVFFALYKLFYVSIELRHEPFFGWIQDLSVHDPFFVTPILMVALMWGQQKITPTPGMQDPENEAVKVQKAMMKWMPFVFGAIMIFLPAGLTLYFLVNAFISVVQQYFLNKKLAEMFPTAEEKVLTTANGKS